MGIAEQTCKQHPNADLEEVLIGIKEAGFWYGRHQSYFSGQPREDAAAEISISRIHDTDAAELEKLRDSWTEKIELQTLITKLMSHPTPGGTFIGE